MPCISRKVESIVESPIRKITALIAAAKYDKELISFGGGAPSLAPPREVVEAITKALRDDAQKATSYGATRGNIYVIESIINDLKSYGVSIDAEQLIITEGATEGIWLAVTSLIEKGQEVIATDPTYIGYETPTELVDARLVRVPTSWENEFQPDLELVKEKINDRTRAFILVSPCNPTGRVLKEEVLRGIADLAEDHDLWIIFDDTYKDIYYEGRYIPIFNIGNASERTVVVFTMSKSASIPGCRVGYTYAPKEAIRAMEKLKQFVTLCPSMIGQIATKAFYSNGVKERYLKEIVLPTYSHRKETMGKFLSEYIPDCGYSTPKGAFYYFVDLSNYLREMGMNEEQFQEALYKEKRVIVIPGRFFGERGKNHVRMTFVAESDERIESGIKKMGEFLRAV